MEGLDTEFPILSSASTTKDSTFDKENSNLNKNMKHGSVKLSLDRFERICSPSWENRVVIYTTTLRGAQKTFEACNAVRATIESSGVQICERDVSMDQGFREELRELLKELIWFMTSSFFPFYFVKLIGNLVVF
ncbi:hypothetical protein K1719_012000 [Acacia pycnantha]|nr:hypothetical protein K1719_012000 [Acacia pycnantha]